MAKRTVEDVAHIEKMMREARLAERERCARIADEFARAAVGNSNPDGTRNPSVYEQGIGAERVAALIRGR